MATKSRNNKPVIWSIVALVIAGISIGYCMPHIVNTTSAGIERFDRTITYLAKLVKGSVI